METGKGVYTEKIEDVDRGALEIFGDLFEVEGCNRGSGWVFEKLVYVQYEGLRLEENHECRF